MLDPVKLKADFPVLSRKADGKPLTYLDSAATTQKPESVIAALDEQYRAYNANVHRGLYGMAEEATERYEAARRKVAEFIGAESPDEIVFTRNTTEAINLVMYGWARHNLKRGDAVLLTEMDHHANLVPWYLLADELDLELRFVRFTEGGRLDREDFERKLDGAKLAAFTHASNVLGTINPIDELTKLAQDAGARVVIDGAQGAPHLSLDLAALKPDWYAFSAHKLFGPSNVGVLWTRAVNYAEMRPMLGGGKMIKRVGLGTVEFADPPHMFEAGSMPVPDVVAFGAAIDYQRAFNPKDIRTHEISLTTYALERLGAVDGLTVYGPDSAAERVPLIAFTVDGVHAHDLASLLDQDGIAVRSGHHCCQPLHERLKVPATTRVSFSIYNTIDDVDRLVESIESARRTFAVGTEAS